MNEAQEFFNKHGLEECKRAYALSVNAGCEDLDMKEIIDAQECKIDNKIKE